MDGADEQQRRHERRPPTNVVRVTAECEVAPRVHGEAVNLSEGGACLALRSNELAIGDELILWLDFARPRQPVPATARVVWTSGGGDGARYGVEWTHRGPQRSWIGWASRA